MFVRLILAGGLKAGTVAEIKQGYYLIGRHEECQIRPQSDSVSDRHCLLQHEGTSFRVFVLDDQSPTLVNHKQLPPKQWQLLNHGDLLQVGRVPFMVAITARAPSLPARHPVAESNVEGERRVARDTSSRQDAETKPSAEPEDDFAEHDTAEIEPKDEPAADSAEPTSSESEPTERAKGNGREQ